VYPLTKFCCLYNRYSPYDVDGELVDAMHQGGSHGQPRSLDVASCLGLVLGCTRTRGGMFGVSVILFWQFSSSIP
jgi:phage-related protein